MLSLFQTDLFGLAGCVHVLLFQDYMKVKQVNDTWKTTRAINRCVPMFMYLYAASCLKQVRDRAHVCSLGVFNGSVSVLMYTTQRLRTSLRCTCDLC